MTQTSSSRVSETKTVSDDVEVQLHGDRIEVYSKSSYDIIDIELKDVDNWIKVLTEIKNEYDAR
jgi:hypothetical protein